MHSGIIIMDRLFLVIMKLNYDYLLKDIMSIDLRDVGVFSGFERDKVF